MRIKTSTLVGFGVGYILGAKAGRERYDQLMGWAQQKWSDVAKPMGEQAAHVLEESVPDAAAKIGDMGGKIGDMGKTGKSGKGKDNVDLTDRVEPYVDAAKVAEHPPLPSSAQMP